MKYIVALKRNADDKDKFAAGKYVDIYICESLQAAHRVRIEGSRGRQTDIMILPDEAEGIELDANLGVIYNIREKDCSFRMAVNSVY